MPAVVETQSYQLIRIVNYVIFGVASVRIAFSYQREPILPLALLLLMLFLVLYASQPFICRRRPGYPPFYLALQTLLVVAIGLLPPAFDFGWVMFIIMGSEVFYLLNARAATAWILLFVLLAGMGLALTMGLATGLATLLLLVVIGYLIVTFTTSSIQAEIAREESRRLLAELRESHQKLQEYAGRAQELATMQERNRVARELHDSVSQTLFSIRLTAQATRLLLVKDPARVATQLDQLQALTNSALQRMRSLITQLRPTQDPQPPSNEVN